MRPRRLILVLSTLFQGFGGIPRFNRMLCTAVDQLAPELGIRGVVISQDDSAEDYRRAGSPWPNLEFVAGDGQLRLAFRTLARCVRERPDLMLVGLLGMTPVGVLCRPFLGAGFGFVAHGTEVWSEPRLSRRWSGRRARFALAVSRHTAAAVERTIGLPAGVIRRLPNTLDPDFELAPPPPDEGSEGRLELLSVARLSAEERRKGVDHTLRAFARLLPRFPEARYRIVGKGTDKPRLIELASSLGVAESVHFEQDLSDADLVERYRRCTAFVLPSGQEGFGIVFLEAMRFAKPCIGGAAGGTPDVIEDGETGYLVPFGDEGALGGAMERLLGDAALRRRLGRAGHGKLEREFTFASYRSLVGRHLTELFPRV